MMTLTLTWFESSVISYGSQTMTSSHESCGEFESSVISYGSQTLPFVRFICHMFESSVISYGSQTEYVDVSRRS